MATELRVLQVVPAVLLVQALHLIHQALVPLREVCAMATHLQVADDQAFVRTAQALVLPLEAVEGADLALADHHLLLVQGETALAAAVLHLEETEFETLRSMQYSGV